VLGVGGDFEELFKLYASLLYLMFYPLFVVFLVVILRMGVYGWVFIGACLTAPTIVWYRILKRRVENYLKAIMNAEPREWNVTETVKEYVKLLKKKSEESS
jgi:hypothetical protein